MTRPTWHSEDDRGCENRPETGSTSPSGGRVFWQVLGIVDLVLAVTLGTLARLISPNGTSAMTVGPLRLTLAFAVPLFIMLHIICIAQASLWQEPKYTGVREQLPASL